METLTAQFQNQQDLERAVAALREQGVIHIKAAEAGSTDSFYTDWQTLSLQAGASDPPMAMNRLQVLVESSRRRQAEDTLIQCGGQL
ncbi:hypothetical protein SAMN02799630_04133 [Paenibacillus sp. UNCCL117]|uniref:hypothetical protein n=1 Tax=unclassified Paenibacillus TaxID=185978 RepID=UPI00088B1EE8|nr:MULTISPECIES: hypothetical protein [unclassified Paenibacillus]SDD85974.1 hypothetical protein SAMN04488602_114119 [Paenibacillus sp. cl123]SFW54263.1 hypothetical protein SAMN02799630_04133 [Paenibacillus sp. UNCCL117]